MSQLQSRPNTRLTSTSELSCSMAELEGVVKKSVDAAMVVFRDELKQLLHEKLNAINERCNTVEKRLDSLESKPEIDLSTVSLRIDCLETQLVERCEVIEQRVDNLELQAGPSRDVSVFAARIDVLEKQLEEIKNDSRQSLLLSNENEQYSRRLNLRFRGLKVQESNCQEKVLSIIKNNLKISSIDYGDFIAHPVPVRTHKRSTAHATPSDSGQSPPPPVTEHSVNTVIVRFANKSLRDEVIRARKALKKSAVSIIEDLTSLNVQTLNRLKNNSRIKSCWSWNGKLFAVPEGQDVKLQIKPFQSLDDAMRVLSATS